MNLKLKIVDSDKDIQNKILKALLSEVSSVFKKARNPLVNNIKNIITNSILSSPEYASLSSGQLKFELGVPDISNRIQSIFNVWFSNIDVKLESPKISGSGIKGSLTIGIIKSDLSDILGSDVAIITDSNTGSSVNWLEWLSLAGDKTIIKDYEVVLGPNRRSRTGNAIMTVSKNQRWKVPSEFSGTVANNWITRAIDSVSDSIEKELLNTIRNSL